MTSYVGQVVYEDAASGVTSIRFQRSNNRIIELKDDLDICMHFERQPVSRLEIREAMTEKLRWSRTPGGRWEEQK